MSVRSSVIRLSRRHRWLSIALIVMLVLFLPALLGRSYPWQNRNAGQPVAGPFFPTDSRLAPIVASADFDWRQYSGITLNFIIENNVYANILNHQAADFTAATGIHIKIIPLEFSTMVEKLHIDLISGTGKFQLVYVDPYQTLPSFHQRLADLRPFIDDPDLPDLPGGLQDFNELHLQIDSYYLDKTRVYTLPLDSPTMLLFYRKDIIAKYGAAFQSETGIDRLPGNPEFSWQDYYQLGGWLNAHLQYQDADYGIGHQAMLHNSLFCDFSNIMAAYGGDYFSAENLSLLGQDVIDGRSIFFRTENMEAMTFYKKLLAIAHPKSLFSNWFELAELFRNGEIAMMPNLSEYLAMVENEDYSKVAGQVRYALLPTGPVRSANIISGSGIGINQGATRQEQEAAWLFLVWVTSPQMQLQVFESADGGDVPTRNSVLALISQPDYRAAVPKVRAANWEMLDVVCQAWQPAYRYIRPKTALWRSMEDAITARLTDLVKSNADPAALSRQLARQFDEIDGQ